MEVSAHPMGIQLVNSQMTHKAGDPNDIVEIARQVQMASDKLANRACSEADLGFWRIKDAETSWADAG